jgi:hypothetical protein
MHSTLNRKTDPKSALFARVDEELAHTFEQLAHADEQIARAKEQLSKIEHDDVRHSSDHPQTRTNTFRPAVRGNRTVFDSPAVRGLTGLLLAACVGFAAIAWQSPSDAAKVIFARWAPQLVSTSSLPLENPGLPAQPSPPTAPVVAPTASPPPARLAQTVPEDVAPTAAALPPELTQLLQSMARDLATLKQGIEQLKASQEQMARDNANTAEQFKASQEQMALAIGKASEQSLRHKTSAPLPTPIAASTRKPVRTLPSPQARAHPQAPTQSQHNGQ